MLTRVLVNHSDTYYWNVVHTAFVAKWRIRFGMSLSLPQHKGKLRIPRRNVVALLQMNAAE